jgi:membrane associated rhomboid family serine protease
MTPTPVGMRCPECARQRTKVTRLRESVSQPTLTYSLIALNVVVYIGESLGGGASAAGSPGGQLVADGALSRATIAHGDYWRLLTSGFLHANLIHLASNMFVLYIMGTLLEPVIGRARFAIIYFVSLLAGSLGVIVAEPTVPAIGASGAIFGLMGAGVIVLRQRGISPMQSGLPLWIGINLVLTFSITGISIGAHIGGLIGGILAALVLFDLPGRVRLPPATAAVLASSLGALAVAGSLALAGSG